MKIISIEDIKIIHKNLIDKTGGIYGVRDEKLLESCLFTPFQTFDNIDIYPTIKEKIAKICYLLISNHCFLDGNKRVGILTMLVLFNINSINIVCDNKDLIHIGLGLADNSLNYDYILNWILKNTD